MTRTNIEKLIQNHKRRLQYLKEKQALCGLDTSPEILIEIEDIETTIKKLRMELKRLDKSGIEETEPGGLVGTEPERSSRSGQSSSLTGGDRAVVGSQAGGHIITGDNVTMDSQAES